MDDMGYVVIVYHKDASEGVERAVGIFLEEADAHAWTDTNATDRQTYVASIARD